MMRKMQITIVKKIFKIIDKKLIVYEKNILINDL